jgi:hypothetical protein
VLIGISVALLEVCCMPATAELSYVLEIAGVLLIVSAIQSLFGVGILLFGTPLLLLLGYPFQQVLWIVLPVSLAISIVQIIRGWKDIQWEIIIRLCLYTLPFTVLGTLYITLNPLIPHLQFWIALYLLLFTIGFYFNAFPKLIEKAMHRRSVYLTVCGILHGLTNLGGSLLSSFVIAKIPDKNKARSTIAVGYGLLVIVQLTTLLVHEGSWGGEPINLLFIPMALLVFFVADNRLFSRFSNPQFKQYFGPILLIISLMLMVRSLL